MERFVRFVAIGGIALVAGLWAVTLFAAGSRPWILGAVLVLLGCGGLTVGIATELSYSVR